MDYKLSYYNFYSRKFNIYNYLTLIIQLCIYINVPSTC
jgi:hypothetical protein